MPDTPLLIFLIVAHTLGVLCIFPALLYTRTPQGTMAWTLALLMVPYIAVPFYLILGKRTFSGYEQARRKHNDLPTPWQELTDSIIDGMRPYAISPTNSAEYTLDTLSNIVHMPVCGGNSCQLLIDAQEAFPEIYDAIKKATSYILIEFYIIKNDAVGQELKELLIKKAHEGVHIHILYDELGSRKLPPGYIHSLRKEGVFIEPFNGKRHFLTNIWRLNFRNHRKMVIVDGTSAFIGGMNIGREYFGEGTLGYWRDTFIKVEGAAVQQAQISFLEDWNWAVLKLPPNSMSYLRWRITPQEANDTALVLPSGPADTIPAWRSAVVNLANQATRRLWISTPYFVPDEGVLTALQTAALRGVDVRILGPKKADHLLVQLSSFTLLRDLSTYGIQVWAYKKGFLHQKAILVDDNLACIGTANLDNRSLTLNFELSVLVNSREFCHDVEKMLNDDFGNSERMTIEKYTNKPLSFKILCHIARLMAPIQ